MAAWVWGEACEAVEDLGTAWERPSWMFSGACVKAETSFFPERGESTADAKQLCAACVVRQQCLEYALTESIRHGIWGGASERERKRLRSQRYQARRGAAAA